MIEIPRFSVVDIDRKKSNHKGIKDHLDGRIVVVLNEINDEETTVSIAEDFISVIENHLEGDDSNGGED